MPPFVGFLNFVHASSLAAADNEFVVSSSLWSWIATLWLHFAAWVEQPNVLAVILAWWITFTIVMTLLLTFGGFGPGGIIAGSLAAGFQAWAYGGFTPAGGIFATITSVGALGFAMPLYAGAAAVIATLVAGLVGAIM